MRSNGVIPLALQNSSILATQGASGGAISLAGTNPNSFALLRPWATLQRSEQNICFPWLGSNFSSQLGQILVFLEDFFISLRYATIKIVHLYRLKMIGIDLQKNP